MRALLHFSWRRKPLLHVCVSKRIIKVVVFLCSFLIIRSRSTGAAFLAFWGLRWYNVCSEVRKEEILCEVM